MKKNILIFSVLFAVLAMNTAYSKSIKSHSLTEVIKAYKAGNYSQSYYMLEDILKNEPGNALAHYYMAITSAQIGKKDEAISNYDAVLQLSPMNNNLNRYAKKGKLCIEEPDKCNESSYGTPSDEFIQIKNGKKLTEEVQSDYEQLKLENFMREMNRKDDVETTRFNEFKDFSSAVPSNDEIVAAMRVLQRAGFSDMLQRGNNSMDLSMFMEPSQTSIYNVMGNNSFNPQLIQALLTNNMTQGF